MAKKRMQSIRRKNKHENTVSVQGYVGSGSPRVPMIKPDSAGKYRERERRGEDGRRGYEGGIRYMHEGIVRSRRPDGFHKL